MRPTTALATLISLAAGTWASATPSIYVDANAPGPIHDGSTWRNAFTDLQEALERAYSGAVYRVASGVYTPDRGTGDREATFQLHGGVSLFGGYAGFGAVDPDERNPGAYLTVLSGDLARDDGPGFTNTGDNAYHVLTGAVGYSGGSLDGVVVAGGNAEHNSGGGLLAQDAGPMITDCVFRDNQASFGGAIYSSGADGMTVRRSRFVDNSAGTGGALCVIYPASVWVQDCLFARNTAYTGGAVANDGAIELVRCIFYGNTSERWGGAIAYTLVGHGYLAMPLQLHMCVFSGNTSRPDIGNGGAIYAGETIGSVALYGCTFANNSAARQGGIHWDNGVDVEIRNTIFWHNRDFTSDTVFDAQIGGYRQPRTLAVSYTTMQGWGSFPPGFGNDGSDPLFVDESGADGEIGTADDNLRLSPGSPAIDSADNDQPYAWGVDIAGNPRPVDDPMTQDHGNGQAPIVDRGAYEYQALDCDSPELDCDDGEACTEDFCKPTAGCVHVPMNCAAGYRCLDGDCIPRCNVTDNDLDGDIDLEDFAVWQNCFTGPK